MRSSAAIGADAAAAAYQPTISVLMPVCETEAWMLEAAVESVLAQAYPNWQLCLADDASERRETLAALGVRGPTGQEDRGHDARRAIGDLGGD
jgi:glycosyltransferase involved in cell wall biosynthesis